MNLQLNCFERTVRPLTPPSSQIQKACYRKRKENGKPNVPMFNSPSSKFEHFEPSSQIGSNHHKWVASCSTVEELEELSRPRTPHRRSPAGERRRKSKRSTIFRRRIRKRCRQSDQHWNCFRGKTEKMLRLDWARVGFPERVDTIFNCTD